MNRDTLHHLVDRAASAAPDDEPVTEADARAIAQARDGNPEVRSISHVEILREFGLSASA